MKIAILGTGKMGSAIALGLLKNDPGAVRDLTVTNTTGTLPRELADSGIRCSNDNALAVSDKDLIIAAVLPQKLREVLRSIAGHVRKNACLVSIAPGHTLKALKEMTDGHMQVVRAMPNTPSLTGDGMIAVCTGPDTDKSALDAALFVLGTLGRTEVVEESQLNAVIAVSGSAPAYVYVFMDALMDAGVLGGLHRDQAMRMSAQMLYGAAQLMLKTGRTPADLKDMVCSPGGTTIEAVAALEKNGFRSAVIEAARAAMDKASRMG